MALLASSTFHFNHPSSSGCCWKNSKIAIPEKLTSCCCCVSISFVHLLPLPYLSCLKRPSSSGCYRKKQQNQYLRRTDFMLLLCIYQLRPSCSPFLSLLPQMSIQLRVALKSSKVLISGKLAAYDALFQSSRNHSSGCY